MSLKVLQNEQQIAAAREELRRKGVSALPTSAPTRLTRLLARVRRRKPLLLGDWLKSWDLLQTVEFLEEHCERDAPILDIGAYASEVLVSLRKDGFTDLVGVDLNPEVQWMPHAGDIRYVVSDFMKTPLADGSFAAITSISVIEHGYNPERLMAEVSRLLRPGGYFVASTDYWREKVDTGGRRYFDMSWLIFSEDDLLGLVQAAARHGLTPVGEWRPETGARAIDHGGFRYTFAWLALKKTG